MHLSVSAAAQQVKWIKPFCVPPCTLCVIYCVLNHQFAQLNCALLMLHPGLAIIYKYYTYHHATNIVYTEKHCRVGKPQKYCCV